MHQHPNLSLVRQTTHYGGPHLSLSNLHHQRPPLFTLFTIVCQLQWATRITLNHLYWKAITTALKRPFENNSTTNKDIIKLFSDLKSTHFILPPLRFSHSSSFYHRSWCENRPFSPPCLPAWNNRSNAWADSRENLEGRPPLRNQPPEQI